MHIQLQYKAHRPPFGSLPTPSLTLAVEEGSGKVTEAWLVAGLEVGAVGKVECRDSSSYFTRPQIQPNHSGSS